jgi:hypothetical protein
MKREQDGWLEKKLKERERERGAGGGERERHFKEGRNERRIQKQRK